ncbi:TetR/AcrR family transcriptional regulator [Radiobacillus sp. PE A8.2]|uniref:TetR/AcrR family transcriptional regulator n=1 Tax=Radiobacillus sp. PE A8.2 TaxID=3380349 RepID=UPI00388FFB21
MFTNNTDLDKRVKRTKNALESALLSLMENTNFKDITITDIVKKADYNRGTFYKHYKYKEDLLDEILEEVIVDLVKSYKEPYSHSKTLDIRNLNSSAIKIFDHVWAHQNLYKLVIKANALPGFQQRITGELKALLIEDVLDARLDSAVNYHIFASYQSYAILGMIIEWVDGNFKYSASYMAEQLVEILKMKPYHEN